MSKLKWTSLDGISKAYGAGGFLYQISGNEQDALCGVLLLKHDALPPEGVPLNNGFVGLRSNAEIAQAHHKAVQGSLNGVFKVCKQLTKAIRSIDFSYGRAQTHEVDAVVEDSLKSFDKLKIR